MSSDGKWSYSHDGELYNGTFDTFEECLAECTDGMDRHFFIGQAKSPPPPEDYFSWRDLAEHASCQDEYSGDWAEDWDRATEAECKELEAEVAEVIREWRERHDVGPHFYNIDEDTVREFRIVGGKLEEVNAKKRVESQIENKG
jgi:hypothetical protein